MQVIKPTPSQAAFVLKRFLQASGIEIQLGNAQEAIARVNGYTDWNSLASVMDPKVGEPKSEQGCLRQHRPNQYELISEKESAVWLKVHNVDVYVESGERGVDVMLYPHGDQDHQLEALDSAQASFDDAKEAITDLEVDQDDPESNNASDKRQDCLLSQLLTADRVMTSQTSGPVPILKKNDTDLRHAIDGQDEEYDEVTVAFSYMDRTCTVQRISIGALQQASYLGESGWVLPSGNELWVYQPKPGEAALSEEDAFKEATARRIAIGDDIDLLVERLLAANWVRDTLQDPPRHILSKDTLFLKAISEGGLFILESAPANKVVITYRTESKTSQVTAADVLSAKPYGPTGWAFSEGRTLFF